MGNHYRAIVAHPAQQHSYKTASALKQADLLFKYVTTVYRRENSLTSLVTRFLSEEDLRRANRRRSEMLQDEEVVQFCELEGLLLLLLQRKDKTRFFYSRLSRLITNKFGRKVAAYVIKNNIDILIMYDTVSYTAFKILKEKAPNVIRIIDMSAPYCLFMDQIFRDDLRQNPEHSSALKKEIESTTYRKTREDSTKEIRLADYFLVASEFSKRSLEYSGVQGEKIFLCPYGVDVRQLNENRVSSSTRDQNDKIRCLFVGRVTQQKGAFYFFRAIKRLDLRFYSFTFVGSYDQSSYYYRNFRTICNFVGHLPKDEMASIYRNSDLLVFPSLADGFGLSVLEALSFGLPVICSSNAGASELIEDGYNGFVVPPGDENAIHERLEWFRRNRSELLRMSENASKSAEKYTWDMYGNKLGSIMMQIIEMEGDSFSQGLQKE